MIGQFGIFCPDLWKFPSHYAHLDSIMASRVTFCGTFPRGRRRSGDSLQAKKGRSRVSREGDDAEAVISAAVAQPPPALAAGSLLREVRPDLVRLADLAARLQVTRQALQKRDMPSPSLGGLYRASEMVPHLSGATGKIRAGLTGAEAWFNAAPGAQRVNAKLSLGDQERTAKRA
jgi:hypothetical protein